jgi:hypothetical protein
MSRLKISSKTSLLSLCIVAFGLSLFLWTEGGQHLLSGWMTRDWVSFDVPSQPVRMNAEVRVRSERVTVCNRSAARWRDVVIRITNKVPVGDMPALDIPLFAKVGDVSVGACVDVPKTQFFSAGWKKIPAPREMNVVRVEILASVTGPGYFVQDESLER